MCDRLVWSATEEEEQRLLSPNISRWRLCVGRHNQQFFTDKAMFGTIVQITDNRLIQLSQSPFKLVDFQRPDWICSSFSSTFKFTGLVEIANIHVGGELFFVHTNRSHLT